MGHVTRFTIVVAMVIAGAALASGDEICNEVLGTVSVEVSADPGFEGLFKYTITLDKHDEDEDDDFGFLLLLGLESCACKCEEGFIVPAAAGEIPGDDKDDHDGCCSVASEYLCNGSQDIPPEVNGPAIRFYGGEGDDCDENDDFEQATLFFYTPLPPGPPSSHQIYLFDDHDDDDKDGSHDDEDEEDGSCDGFLDGTLPSCDCTVDAVRENWGTVKSRFAR